MAEPKERNMEISAERKATIAGAFLCKENDRGVVMMKGNDARDLLHRLSSARIDNLKDGQLRETLLTTEKGRVIDALLAVQGSGPLRLLTSSGKTSDVIAWLQKFTIMEDCEYEDVSGQFAQYSIYNLPADGSSPLPDVTMPETGGWVQSTICGFTVELLRHESVTGAGLRILCSVEEADALWTQLVSTCGLSAVGSPAHTLWRVENLLPAVNHELGALSNPLEAGAESAVDFRKGCFIGQEVIARLDSYDKVQRHPRRLVFSANEEINIEVGTELRHTDGNAGFVSTAVFDPDLGKMVGIGLLRLAYEAEATTLHCGEIETRVQGEAASD